MEHTPDQRTPTPPASPEQHSPGAAPARPSRAAVAQRGTRLIARRVLYGTARFGRAIRPYAAFLAIIVVLLTLTSWLALRAVWPSGQAADVRASSIDQSNAVESYLRGQHDFNADMMWSAYSANYQSEQLQRGASKQTLQNTVKQLQSQGLRFANHEYVGGVPTTDGGRMYFYAVQVDAGAQHLKIPMTFMVDQDGQVERIISPLSLDSNGNGNTTN